MINFLNVFRLFDIHYFTHKTETKFNVYVEGGKSLAYFNLCLYEVSQEKDLYLFRGNLFCVKHPDYLSLIKNILCLKKYPFVSILFCTQMNVLEDQFFLSEWNIIRFIILLLYFL